MSPSSSQRINPLPPPSPNPPCPCNRLAQIGATCQQSLLSRRPWSGHFLILLSGEGENLPGATHRASSPAAVRDGSETLTPTLKVEGSSPPASASRRAGKAEESRAHVRARETLHTWRTDQKSELGVVRAGAHVAARSPRARLACAFCQRKKQLKVRETGRPPPPTAICQLWSRASSVELSASLSLSPNYPWRPVCEGKHATAEEKTPRHVARARLCAFVRARLSLCRSNRPPFVAARLGCVEAAATRAFHAAAAQDSEEQGKEPPAIVSPVSSASEELLSRRDGRCEIDLNEKIAPTGGPSWTISGKGYFTF